MKNLILLAALWLNLMPGGLRAEGGVITPGALWMDNEGVHINAHGGGVLRVGDLYYWYGEHKIEGDEGNRAHVGVSCYSSKNLVDWRREGVALAVVEEAGHDLEKGCIIERPKVIFNPKTKQFVMWFHLELKGQGYSSARSGVAVSDRPAGPFKYVRSMRANAGQYPVNLTLQERRAVDQYRLEGKYLKEALKMPALQIFARDFEGGQMARDMTLFVDDDGLAYHIFSSEENRTLHIARLSDDWLSHSGEFARVEPGGRNEAPALFKHEGRYYMLTSGMTGWAPNAAKAFAADSLYGSWTYLGNPCRGLNPGNGMGAELTFGGQSTFILPVEGKTGTRFIAMFDIWRPKNAIDGRYVWLPLDLIADGFVVHWKDKWSVTDFLNR